MKKAVIYARYSSERQNEQSIAGQVEVCRKWADDNDIDVVDVYKDEALTGRSDKRPGFQRLVKDAKAGRFEYVIVYKVDRFARNRYDSAIYKAQLKKCGVRVISAMENIADGPEGIILESVLEGMAEYYSANLAQNVIRGMRQKAEQAKYMGGAVPLGFKIDADKNYVIDDNSAVIVRTAFQMFADGKTCKSIIDFLNERGYRTSTGKPFTYSALHSLLINDKYIGRYEYLGIVLDDAIPRIVSNEVYAKVQKKLAHNRRAPASAKAKIAYLLTGKLFCGKCNGSMVGDSGTSKTGATHYYYSCIEKKRRHGCTKKSVKKDWIEQLIVDVTMSQVLTDENIERISQKAYEIYEAERRDDTELASLNSALKEAQRTIDNIMKAIEQGIITDTTKQRLIEAEARKKDILTAIDRAEVKRPNISKEHIEFFLNDIRNRVYEAEDQAETIISTFVNAVYLYDDKLIITYNFREGENLKKLELDDIEKFGFASERFTITILSELLLFAIMTEVRSR